MKFVCGDCGAVRVGMEGPALECLECDGWAWPANMPSPREEAEADAVAWKKFYGNQITKSAEQVEEAKMGNQKIVSMFENLSGAERRELLALAQQDRVDELHRRRAELLEEIEDIDRELTALSGAGDPAKKTPSATTAAKAAPAQESTPTLVAKSSRGQARASTADAVEAVLRDDGGAMTSGDIADALMASDPAWSKLTRKVAQQRISACLKNKRFEKAGEARGSGYVLVSATKA